MTVDNTPAIRAFAEERLKIYDKKDLKDKLQAIVELELIITLCDGLTKQAELLAKVHGDSTALERQ